MRTPSERRRTPIRLTVSTARPGPGATGEERVLSLPPLAAGALAGATAAASGWVLVTACCLVAWFTATAMPIPAVLGFASQFWLTAHATGAMVGGRPVTLIPLGLTMVLVVLVRILTRIAQRQAEAGADLQRGSEDESSRLPGRLKVALAASGGYAVVSSVICLGAGLAPRLWLAALGGAVIALVGAAWGLWPDLAAVGSRRLPPWLTSLPGAVGRGLLAMIGSAAVALGVGMVAGWNQISRISAALDLDGVGAFLVALLQLLYLPNLLAWVASFLSGAGFSVGIGSLVAPMGTHTGILPAIPILGALPVPGPGGPAAYLWLVPGVLMGALAGARAVRAQPRPAKLLVALGSGALAGALTGVVLLGLAVLSRGDLGALRLVGLGPRLPELSWLAPSLGLLGGLLGGLTQRLTAAHGDRGAELDDTRALPLHEQATARIG